MNRATLVHEKMDQFSTRDNMLVIGGLPLDQLAHTSGQTPFYVYDSDVILQNIANFKKHIPEKIKLHYAIKANPMPDVVNFLATRLDGFDLASIGELKLALNSGMNPNCISFAGPGKLLSDLTTAIRAGITINIESEAELRRAMIAAEGLGMRPKIAVRINPDFELKLSGMKMGGGPKQFGIDSEILPTLLQSFRSLDLDFQGFQIFTGSQNLNPEAIVENQEKTFELAIRLSQHLSSPIKKLNIGGGFGIPYFPGEHHLDLSTIGEKLTSLSSDLYSQLGNVDIIMELGRYLVGNAGVYVTRVIERKISRGKCFLITDGGMHHNLAVSGNLGQIIRKNYPVAIGNRMNSKITECVTVVGRLCTPLDLLADNMTLSKAEEGDYVVIFQSGAYGLSASPTNFLSHPHPNELFV